MDLGQGFIDTKQELNEEDYPRSVLPFLTNILKSKSVLNLNLNPRSVFPFLLSWTGITVRV
jgi:hypothetical protein